MRRPISKKWQQWCLLTALLILAQAAPWMATSGYSGRSDQHLLLIEEPFEIMGKDYTPYAGNANRSRHVTLNPFLTHPDYVAPGDQLLIEFFEDVMFEAVVDSVMTNNIGTLIIRARINEKNFSHLLIVSTNHQTSVWVNVPETGKQYNITDNQLIEIKQENLDNLPLIVVEIPENAESLGVSDAFASSLSRGDDPALGSGHLGLMPDQLGVDDLATISVMIVYTPAARQWASSRGGIHNIIATAMANAQLVHDNSATGVTLELVHSAEVAYVESGDSSTDLARLTGTQDGHMDEVHPWRDMHGADLVALFAHVSDVGGVGYLLTNPNGSPAYGVSLTRVQEAATRYTHAHEMGHNMGLHHHKEQNIWPGPGLSSYSAGWRWTGTDDRKYCSVMTYTSGSYFSDGVTHTMVPYFSDPNIYYLGVPTGDVLDGDNARTVREIKHVIAAYRAGPIIPHIEREAMIALYESTDGDNWVANAGWKSPPLAADGFAMPGTECSWGGVYCVGNSVSRLILPALQLNGTIPPQLGNLSELTSLWLYDNQLTGLIPSELGNLINLIDLGLANNQLTGAIPPELGNTNLTSLSLNYNQLSGTIPVELGNLAELDLLNLSHNQLIGSIPTEFTKLTGLDEIDICNNYLYTDDDELRDFLNNLQSGWEDCQYALPDFSFTPAGLSVPASAGSTSINISNTGGGTLNWMATVTSGGDWLSITSGSSGVAAGTVTCAYNQNTGGQRVGVIRFESITEQSHDYQVTQTAASHTLNSAVSPSAGGSVTRSPNEPTFTHNDTVQLTANPNPGYSFSHWSGGATGSSNPVTVTMDSDKSVMANFTALTYTLSTAFSPSGGGSVTINPSKPSYSYNETVQLTAIASSWFKFSHWSGGASGSSNPISITMDSNKSVTANFAADIAAPTFTPDGGIHTGETVSVTVSCATPGVTIRYTTNGNDPIESSPTVASGGTVTVPVPGTLKAKAWLSSDTSATTTAAYAGSDDRIINLSILGRGFGNLNSQPAGISCLGTDGDTCTGVFDADAQITLTANPEPGSAFKGWSADCAGQPGNTCTLIMDTDKIIEAHLLLKGQPNAIGDYLSIVTLTPAERDFLLDIGDGTKPFPDTWQVEEVRFQNDMATIHYRDGTSQVVNVKHGDGYSDDFINAVLLSDTSDHTFTNLLNLPSFDVELEFPGNSVVICYPGISPVDSGPGIEINDLALLKLKPVGQPSLPFAYRVNAPVDGDFWFTNHLQEAVLPPTHTLNPGQVVDLYLAVEDNGLYDLDDTSNVIVDPLVLGQVEEQVILPSSELSYPPTSSTGSYNVSWSASTGAVAYRLEYSTDGGNTWALRYTGSDRSYAETVGNGSYRYKVMASDGSTDSAWQTGTHDCVVNIQAQAESGGGGGGCFIDAVLR